MASTFNEITPHRKEEAKATLSEEVFSKMTFANVCPGEFAGVKKEIFLEPLVGHFRHPLALKQCQPADEKAKDINIMDLSYILLNPWPAADISLVFPGKRYLFDLGTSAFESSLQYLTTQYRQAGIEFDSIWAWEVTGTDPVKYWRNVPDSYHSRLHFYNTPITDNFNHAAHPLNILRSIFQQGDFVVVKLDIDNGPLESAFIKEIESDSELRGSIAEMLYEQHYDPPDMSPWFGLGNGASLAEVTNTFSTLRESGLLLHYWP